MDVDLGPTILNLTLYDNDGTKMSFTFRDKITHDLVDVSDGVWKSQWRERRTDVAFVEWAIDDSAANVGVVVVIITAANMADIDLKGEWDLQFTPTGEDPNTPFSGTVKKGRDVTR